MSNESLAPSLNDELRSDRGGVKSALRVLSIFEFFATTGKPATLVELCERLDLPKSSCFALMETLRREGYVYLLGKRAGYYPTSRWRVQGESISRNDPVLTLVHRHLEELRDVTGETAIFGKRDGNRALYLDVREAAHDVRFTAHPGQRKMMHSGASGRALLGLMPLPERRAFIAQLDRPALSSRTLVAVDDVERAVEHGLAEGWHVAIGENRPEITSIAAAFRISGEDYFFCIGGPTQRIAGKESVYGAAVAKQAAAMEQEVSWS